VEIVISTAALRHQASSKAESISRVTRRLQQQFPELEAETVEAVVNERYHMFDGRPIRVFIPILVEHAAANISMAVILRRHDPSCATAQVISRYRPGTENRGGVNSTVLGVVGSRPYAEIVA